METVNRDLCRLSLQPDLHTPGDNHNFFPSEEECDDDKVALFRSKISRNFLIYGPVDPCTIAWSDPINTNIFNNICINALSIHDILEQFLLTVSKEKYSDPSSRDKLAKITKERGILNIMNYIFLDKVNHKVFNVCTPRNWVNWVKISTIPPRESVLYMSRSPTNPTLPTQWMLTSRSKWTMATTSPSTLMSPGRSSKCYNFIISANSSSTKVRMTTDSSMCSESGLSLSNVTKPAPGDVPSLHGILLLSRCHNFYAV